MFAIVTLFKHIKLNSNMSRMVSFKGEMDRYEGIHVKLCANDTANNWHDVTNEQFEQTLNKSLLEWTSNNCRVSWFQIPLQLSKFVSSLANCGYVFHHSKTDYVVMNKWLSLTDTNNIPSYAYTNVGVGGLVVDDRDRVLVVKEKHFVIKKIWKFPGGYANQGEDFGDTAVREVLEETGVLCRFESMIAIRHFHKFAFGCSDIYIVCHLTPVVSQSVSDSVSDDNEIKKCDQEIDECQWMSIDELRPQLTKFNRFILDKFLLYRQKRININCEKIDVEVIKDAYHVTYSINFDDHDVSQQ